MPCAGPVHRYPRTSSCTASASAAASSKWATESARSPRQSRRAAQESIRHWRETNRSPIPSAKRLPSSPAASAATRVTRACISPYACQPRIWLTPPPDRRPYAREIAAPPRSTAGRCRSCVRGTQPAAVSTRASSAGRRSLGRSSPPRLPAPRAPNRQDSSIALSANARARSAGGAPAFASSSAACSQNSPSRMLAPRQPQRPQCRARVSATATSWFSRLHANAARRLSISASPGRGVAHRRRRPACRAGPPTRCSGRGGGPDVVGLAGLAELFQRVLAHRLQQPVSRRSRRCRRRRRATCPRAG